MTRARSTSVNDEDRNKSALRREDLNIFRSLLLKNREQILGDLHVLRESLKAAQEIEAGSSSWSLDFADAAAETAASEHTAFQIRRLSADLEQLTAALHRLEMGTFGICARCGNAIEKERLEVLPYTRRCMKCKTAAERM